MPCVLHCPSDLCQCSLFGMGKSRFLLQLSIVAPNTVTDRYGKEPYSAPIVTKAPGRTEVTGREVNESRHRLCSAVPPVYSIHTIMHFDTTGTQRSFVHSTAMSLLSRYTESPPRSLLETANRPRRGVRLLSHIEMSGHENSNSKEEQE